MPGALRFASLIESPSREGISVSERPNLGYNPDPVPHRPGGGGFWLFLLLVLLAAAAVWYFAFR